jgi:hypothetical protein
MDARSFAWGAPHLGARLVVVGVVGAAGVIIAACSSAAKQAPIDVSSQTVRTTVVTGVGDARKVDATPENAARSMMLPVGPDAVWRVLPDVYTELGITVDFVTQRERRLGTEQLVVRRRMGGVPLTKYLDCGVSGSGGGTPNAETYEITLSVASQVTSRQAGSSIVTTWVSGLGKSVTFSGQVAACTTTGQLERTIEAKVRERVTTG